MQHNRGEKPETESYIHGMCCVIGYSVVCGATGDCLVNDAMKIGEKIDVNLQPCFMIP